MTEPYPESHEEPAADLAEIFTDLSEVMEHIATAARNQAETRLHESSLSPTELRVLSRLLRDPRTSVNDMATPFFPSSGLVRAAQSLTLKGLLEVTAPAANADAVRYAPTAAALRFRNAMRDYRVRCFRYALTGVSETDRADLEKLSAALRAFTSALGYREPAPLDEQRPDVTNGGGGDSLG